jgi:hypothetical protein
MSGVRPDRAHRRHPAGPDPRRCHRSRSGLTWAARSRGILRVGLAPGRCPSGSACIFNWTGSVRVFIGSLPPRRAAGHVSSATPGRFPVSWCPHRTQVGAPELPKGDYVTFIDPRSIGRPRAPCSGLPSALDRGEIPLRRVHVSVARDSQSRAEEHRGIRIVGLQPGVAGCSGSVRWLPSAKRTSPAQMSNCRCWHSIPMRAKVHAAPALTPPEAQDAARSLLSGHFHRRCPTRPDPAHSPA